MASAPPPPPPIEDRPLNLFAPAEEQPTQSAAPGRPPPPPSEPQQQQVQEKEEQERHPSAKAMAMAHEYAMEAAGALNPQVGDHKTATAFIKKALAALELGAAEQ